MTKKPSYEELQARVEALSREIEALRESAEKFRTIFENANDHIAYVGMDGTIIEVNRKFEDVFGYRREAVIGKKFYDFGVLSPPDWQRCIDLANELLSGRVVASGTLEFEATGKDGRKIIIEVNPRAVVKDGEVKGVLAITRDVTDRKREEELLRKHRDDLERLVRERTSNLEEANMALRLMLRKAEEVRSELENTLLANVKELVFPYLEKLKKSGLTEVQRTYLEGLEANLNTITSPLLPGGSARFMNLTPAEIRVADLVKQGKTTKEIAEVLGMSPRTIDTHRYNIRAKLGLKKQKVNLRTHLLAARNT